MQASGVVPRGPILKYLASLFGTYCLLMVLVSCVPSISHHFTDMVTSGAAFALLNLGFVAQVYSQATDVGPHKGERWSHAASVFNHYTDDDDSHGIYQA